MCHGSHIFRCEIVTMRSIAEAGLRHEVQYLEADINRLSKIDYNVSPHRFLCEPHAWWLRGMPGITAFPGSPTRKCSVAHQENYKSVFISL
jgi:hypothetical protein